MECHPRHCIVEQQPRRRRQFGEPRRWNAGNSVAREVNALAVEERDRVRRVEVTRDIEVAKIKLPDKTVFSVGLGFRDSEGKFYH